MKKSKFLIIGGDLRQTYCANLLGEAGHEVSCFLVPGYHTPTISIDVLKKYISNAKYILCPIPFSRDKINISTYGEYADTKLSADLLLSLINENQTLISGAIHKGATDILTKRDIPYYDLMTFQSFKEANSRLTAEGLLKDIIEICPFSIPESNILLTGYGNCGKYIASVLSLLGGHITIYNRNKSYDCMAKMSGFTAMTTLPANDEIKKFNLIINTIPSVIFTPEHLKHIHPKACLLDIAGSPGGFQTDIVKEKNLTFRVCPGIPGKTSPMTAARIICHIINEEI